MSQSTDACIAFGFDLGVEGEDTLLELLGFDEETQQKLEEGEMDLDEWFSKTWPGLVLERHCHVEDPMFIVAIDGTVRSASRGEQEELYFGELTEKVTSKGRHQLAAFAKAYKLEPPDFTWLLFSYWH